MSTVRDRIKDIGITIGYGHIGDSNLHLGCTCFKGIDPKVMETKLEPFIYEQVKTIPGSSISAEWGLGTIRAPYLNL